MPKYDNYSPNIPTTDYEPEPAAEAPAAEAPQSVPQPARRRRTRVERREAAVAQRIRNEQTRKQQSPATGQPDRVTVWTQVKNAIGSPATKIVAGIVLGGTALWLAIAFVSFLANCIADQSLVISSGAGMASGIANDAGEGGARLGELLINQGFGLGAVVIVVWLACVSLKLLVGYPKFRTLDFTVKSLIAMITLSVVVGMLCIGLDTAVNWGGFHGRLINEMVYGFIGWSGAFILSVVLIAIFVVICLRDVVKWVLKKKRECDERRRLKREAEEAERRKQEEIRAMALREQNDEALSGEGVPVAEAPAEAVKPESVVFDPEADTLFDLPEEDDDDEKDSGGSVEEEKKYGAERVEEDEIIKLEAEKTLALNGSGASRLSESTDDIMLGDGIDVYRKTEGAEATRSPESAGNPETSANSDNNDKPDSSEKSDKIENPVGVMTVNVNQIEKGSGVAPEDSDGPKLFTHDYKFPPATFLRPGVDKISVDVDEQIENKERIRKTLNDFGIAITSIEATVGPTVTLYEIRPDAGVKIAKIRNLEDDIALSLSAKGVRIIAPIPGKGTVGIEVANKDPQTVSMRTIIQSKDYQEPHKKLELPIALGSTISNEVYLTDLTKMPHLLVAGATGQGKSVGLNAIITSLLYKKRPEELKFVMVDPKRVEFSLYSKIEKYYLAKIPDSEQPIITNMENVVATLSSLCVEMDERYKLLEKAYVRQVVQYNEKFRAGQLDPREGHRFMPYIVVIIDEFADLIMTAGKEVEVPIARLAQLARAVGIHVIVATQRPSTNVITGMIKANFPARIAFKVSSGVDSKTILDSTGAQRLIGRGDMLISNNGETVRVQCAYVDTPEVEEICDYISRQPYPQGAYILPEPLTGGDGDSGDIDAASLGKKDPLLEEVARGVVMSGTASTSAVQRRYEIGYNRAGRIMDQLQAYGVVGPATGGKPRDVLVDAVTLESILAAI